MVPFPEFLPFLPFYNLCFFIFGVPFVLWLNNRTKSDILCLILGIAYMILYGIFFEPPWDEVIFFYIGLVVGYVTDYWAVKANKWKYHPWDPEFGYSYYVGFSWGMVSIFTYNISKSLTADPSFFFLPGIIFVIPMVIFEWRFGNTRRDQYFLFARAIFTFLAFWASNNLSLLFIAIFVGSYIEFAGVNWIRNWLYIDTMSYIFISFGYSLLVYLSKFIIEIINGVFYPIAFIFLVLAVVAFFIDLFWVQKKIEVDTERAIIAANKYHQTYEAKD